MSLHPRSRQRWPLRWLLVALVLVVGGAGSPEIGLADDQFREVCRPVSDAEAKKALAGSDLNLGLRHRVCRLDLSAFPRDRDTQFVSLVLRLFPASDTGPAVTFVTRLRRFLDPSPTAHGWQGGVQGLRDARVSAVLRPVPGARERIALIRVKTGTAGSFAVLPLGREGLYLIREVDFTRYPHGGLKPPPLPPRHAIRIPDEVRRKSTYRPWCRCRHWRVHCWQRGWCRWRGCWCGRCRGRPRVQPPVEEVSAEEPKIRLLVVYTDDAREQAGGTDAINGWIDAAVQDTNEALGNVELTVTVECPEETGRVEVAYDESAGANYGAVLKHVRVDGDGYMDSVHDTRDEMLGDVVVLLVEKSGSGLAHRMIAGWNDHAFKDYAFAVVNAESLPDSAYTFTHELGHILGGCHDTACDDELFPYAHGYEFSYGALSTDNTPTLGTIMGTPAPGRRRLYWSTPDEDITYGGVAVGVADEADNKRVIEQTAATVAGFR